jgi:pimeloyl-ACP methyl ester carboxylesterase
MLMLLPQILSAQPNTVQEVSFLSGENELRGTLVMPNNAAQAEVPVLVYMGGIDEWGNIHEQRAIFIEENLVGIFPPSGIGVFYYDPRGTGESEGKWGRAELQDFANDALAAVGFLSRQKGIDAERIGVLGHGEDGMVAQYVANSSSGKVKLIASLAGPVFDYEMQLVNQYHSEYICNGEENEVAHEKAIQKAQSHKNWVTVLPIIKRWRHMNMKQAYDPVAQLRNIDIPALFVFGENDANVYPSWSIEELNSIFPNGLPLNFMIQAIAGANHYFHLVDSCFEYDQRFNGVGLNSSFSFKEILRDWIMENI